MSLYDALARTPEMDAIFSDRRLLEAALAVEVALSEAQADCGLIPASSAAAIKAAADPSGFDMEKLAHDTLRAGVLTVPLVKGLTELVAKRDAAAAGHIHFGATSQDIVDTALVLVLGEAAETLLASARRLAKALDALAEKHRDTIMLGRTLMQPGLARDRDASRIVQFGGAVGTLSALGDKGIAVTEKLAQRLGLAIPPAPWHTRREPFVALGTSAAHLGLAAANIAEDLALLMQFEVGEVAEPGGAGRGGSSTMPHKRNPTASMVAMSAAHQLPGLIGTLSGSLIQEHERAAGRWQAEWPVLRSIFMQTHAILGAMIEAIEGLKVFPERMQENIERLNGLVFAEGLMLQLARPMGRGAAHKLVDSLVAKAIAEKRHLRDVALAAPEVTAHLSAAAIGATFDPRGYLGSAGAFVDRMRAAAQIGRCETLGSDI
jgi:3-carboxy-cis,cis-muconate cycloisomerase